MMDLKKISTILSMDAPDVLKKSLVLKEIAKDDDSVSHLVLLIEENFRLKKELIKDLNLELSRMSVFAVQKKRAVSGNNEFSMDFVLGKMWDMYNKWSGYVGHCFNMKDPRK